MKKFEKIYSKIVADISSEKFGVSGSRFLSVRGVADKYDVSLVTALKIKDLLVNAGLLVTVGKKVFVINGKIEKNTDIKKTRDKQVKLNNIIGVIYSGNNGKTVKFIKKLTAYALTKNYKILCAFVPSKDEDVKIAVNDFFTINACAIIFIEDDSVIKNCFDELYYPLPCTIIKDLSDVDFMKYKFDALVSNLI